MMMKRIRLKSRFELQWRIRRLIWQHCLRTSLRNIHAKKRKKSGLSIRIIRVVDDKIVRVR